jgi:hypothetical protein
MRVGDPRRCDFAGVRVVVRAFRTGLATAAGSDRSDQRGRFEIALAPGRYLLCVTLANVRPEPVALAVRPAAWTVVTLRYLIPPYME